jgi:hypothetical protein
MFNAIAIYMIEAHPKQKSLFIRSQTVHPVQPNKGILFQKRALEKTYRQLFCHQKGVRKVSFILPKTGFFV